MSLITRNHRNFGPAFAAGPALLADAGSGRGCTVLPTQSSAAPFTDAGPGQVQTIPAITPRARQALAAYDEQQQGLLREQYHRLLGIDVTV